MTIEFRCDCGELFQVEDELAGRKGRCPTCKRIMVVPEKEAEPLELREEISDGEEEAPGTQPQEDVLEPAFEPPMGGRVEEEVEVLRGWDGPEPDLERMENSVSKPPAGFWMGIPRPLSPRYPSCFGGWFGSLFAAPSFGAAFRTPGLRTGPFSIHEPKAYSTIPASD